MQKTGLASEEGGVKIGRGKKAVIEDRQTDDIMLLAESSNDLKCLLRKVKEDSAKKESCSGTFRR